jgi:hypothetical protein
MGAARVAWGWAAMLQQHPGNRRTFTWPGSLCHCVRKPALQLFPRREHLLQQAGLLRSVRCCEAMPAQQAVARKVLGAAAEVAVPLLQALCAARQNSLGRRAEGCDESCCDPHGSAGRVIAAAAAAAVAVAAPLAAPAGPPAFNGMRQRPATMPWLTQPRQVQKEHSLFCMQQVLQGRSQQEEHA